MGEGILTVQRLDGVSPHLYRMEELVPGFIWLPWRRWLESSSLETATLSRRATEVAAKQQTKHHFAEQRRCVHLIISTFSKGSEMVRNGQNRDPTQRVSEIESRSPGAMGIHTPSDGKQRSYIYGFLTKW